MSFNWVDWTIIAMILISGGLGALNGFIKEILGLLVWVVAGVLSLRYAGVLAEQLTPHIQLPSTRILAAGAMLFVLTLLVGAVVTRVLDALVQATGLKGTDRLLGLVFGMFRGLCLVVLAVGLLRMGPVQNDPWWKQSVLLPDVLRVVDWASAQIPGLLNARSSAVSDLLKR